MPACTMVQWHTQKIIPSKSRHPKIIFNCKSANYKTVQAISDTFRIIKTPKNAIFGPKNASKNTLFASFSIKNFCRFRAQNAPKLCKMVQAKIQNAHCKFLKVAPTGGDLDGANSRSKNSAHLFLKSLRLAQNEPACHQWPTTAQRNDQWPMTAQRNDQWLMTNNSAAKWPMTNDQWQRSKMTND